MSDEKVEEFTKWLDEEGEVVWSDERKIELVTEK